MGNGKQLGNGNCIRNSAQAENLTGLGGIGDGAPQQVGQLNHPRYQLAIGFGEDTLGEIYRVFKTHADVAAHGNGRCRQLVGKAADTGHWRLPAVAGVQPLTPRTKLNCMGSPGTSPFFAIFRIVSR